MDKIIKTILEFMKAKSKMYTNRIDTVDRIKEYTKEYNEIIEFILSLLEKYYNVSNITYPKFKTEFKQKLEEYINSKNINTLFNTPTKVNTIPYQIFITSIETIFITFRSIQSTQEESYKSKMNKIHENIAQILLSIEADNMRGGSNNKNIIKKKRMKTIRKHKYKKNKTGKRKKGKRTNNTPKLMNAKKSNKKVTISQILINNLKK